MPGQKPDTHLTTLNRTWDIARAGLPGVRLHDLRHSFASSALALGESLPMIGKLPGHSRTESTARYTHLARSAVHKAAERVADSLAKDILRDARRRSVRGRAGAAVGHAGLHSRTIGPRASRSDGDAPAVWHT